MFELTSRTVCASTAMPTGFIFSSVLFVYGFVHPKLPNIPSLFEFGLKSPLGTFLIFFPHFVFVFSASGGVNKGLKNCSENFNISVLMHRGRAKCKSPRGEGKQRRREGEPEMLYNREDIEGQMGKCKDI